MEKMYQDYKDIAEFRLIYIREAHAADSNWATRVAREKGINEHKDFGERCSTAKMLMDDKSLTMPMLIDGMDNAANEAYSAHPDRIFLVRSDGRLAIAADRGPRGFNPALKQVDAWLVDFAKTKKEPELTEQVLADADKATAQREARRMAELVRQITPLVGDWAVSNVSDGNKVEGVISFAIENQQVIAKAKSGNEEAVLQGLRVEGNQVSFSVTMHGTLMRFSGIVDGKSITGKLIAGEERYESTWTKN